MWKSPGRHSSHQSPSIQARAIKRQSPAEELANSLTHGLGLLISIAGLTVLVVFAALRGDAWHITSFSIYGGSLVLLYMSSTLYHSFPVGDRKRFLRLVDHACIYLLIAGTYTPFTLTLLRGPLGWTLFGLIWGLAVSGIVFKIFLAHRYPVVSTVAYVLMGWVAVIAIKPLIEAMPLGGILWMVAGGVAYTGGVTFYVLDGRYPFFHTIWHLCVMIGSLCHFFAVLFYVLP